MYDFARWQAWLQSKAVELNAEGFKSELRIGVATSPKPGMVLGITGIGAIGSFENWITGETDYTVLVPPTPSAKMASQKWGVVLTDDTFEAAFRDFLSEFKKLDSENSN